jgi:putative ABC transport system permease protein
VLALVVACVITLAVNPLFAGVTGRPLPSLISLPLHYQAYFLALLVAGTFLSGIYPALVLSRYRPVAVLKGLFKNSAGGQWLRKGLIVGQFAVSIILIAGTMIVYRQLHYMQNHESGADINETLVIKGALGSIPDSAYRDVYSAFKEEMLKMSGIKSITASSGIMGEEILWSTNWNRIEGGSKQAINLFHLGIDADFIESYGLKIVAGEPFSRVWGADRKKIILNESAVRTLGFSSPKAAIGQLVSGGQNSMDSLEVKGVIADYHNEGLQKSIQPLVVFANRRTRGFYSVKMQGKNAVSTVASINKIWDRFFPGDPFDYFFLDEFFNRQYAENKRFGAVFGLFAILAIGIACFGLLGLSAYNVLQRTKEIGVRKVLGASVNSLVLTLSKDFLVLVAFAFVIAIPITMLAMNSWLQDFAYRTSIPWWLYALAGVFAFLIALLTVGFQSLKAAIANPINSLRTE